MNPWLMISLLLVTAGGSAALLRWARFPSPAWPVLGGMIAGLLLGPTIFGRVFPGQYESWLIGGAPEREARDSIIRRYQADELAAEHAGSDSSVLSEMHSAHAREIEPFNQALAKSRWMHQQPMRVAALGLIALTLLSGGFRNVSRAAGLSRPHWISASSIGLWSAGLPGGLAFAVCVGGWDLALPAALAVTAAVAIGPWALTTIDREAAESAEIGGARLMQTSGRVASTVALGAVVIALWRARGFDGLLLATSLLALPVSWLFRASSGFATSRIPEFVLIPALAALVAVKIDVFAHFALWPMIVLILLSSDARWLGALLGALLPGGRPALRTMRLVLGASAAGPTQLALATLALHVNLLAERFVFPLLLGALVIELTAPMRRSMARQLIETEEEIEAMKDE